MPQYARIQSGVVAELFSPPVGVLISDCFAPGLVWVDVTAQPAVQPGWTYDGTVFAAPGAPIVQAPPTVISSGAFLTRFTQSEQLAVQTAAGANAQIGLGLTMGLARGVIDLTDATVSAWMTALVVAGCITNIRRTAILTP
jgi:hypothetical protein